MSQSNEPVRTAMAEELRQLYLDGGLERELVESISLVENGTYASVPYVRIPERQALELWHLFRGCHSFTGRFPAVVPANAEGFSYAPESIATQRVIDAALREEKDPDWIYRIQERFNKLTQSSWNGDGVWAPKSHELSEYRGTWPESVSPRHQFDVPRMWDGHDGCILLLPRCEAPWMLPAQLHASAANDRPDAVTQCTMLKKMVSSMGR